MKTWKITKLVSVNEFNWDHWTTYYIKMELDNWDTISLWKKNKDAFKVWDEVKYEEYQNSKWFTAWKEVRENNFKKWEYKQDQRGYFTSIAFQIWFTNYKKEDDYQNCVYLSKRIFADMMDNYESKEPEKAEQKTEDKKPVEEELPF